MFSGFVSTYAGTCGEAGDIDGGAQEALFSDVFDIQCLANCSVLVAEPGTGRVRLILDSDHCPASATPGIASHLGCSTATSLHDTPRHFVFQCKYGDNQQQ